MPPNLPRRTRTYRGEVNHSEIWAEFALRPDDVIVATPPKCGTTWTQAIVTMLIHGRAGTDIGLNDLSPWLDCGFRDRAAIARQLAAQPHRRCIKSHNPLDAITYDPACTYLAVYRHPVDAHFSMRRHAENMKEGLVPGLMARFPEDVAEGFRMFVEDASPDGSSDMFTLDSIVYHYRSFRDWAHLPNVHLVHYADLSRDLAGEVARIAHVLGISHPPEVMAEIVEGARFATMQANARSTGNRDRVSSFRNPGDFFDSGTSGKWRARLDDAQMAAYRARIADLLGPWDIAWIEYGAAGGPDGT